MKLKHEPASYNECMNLLNKKDSLRLGNNVLLCRATQSICTIRHHKTDIITYYENGEVYVTNGSWDSPTTKNLLNELLWEHGISIWQKDFVWYYRIKNGETKEWRGSLLFNALTKEEIIQPKSNLLNELKDLKNHDSGINSY